MTRINELVHTAGKAIAAFAAPVITKLVIDVLDVVESDVENLIAVLAAAVAVYLVPNREPAA
jgi:hypothetical protein